MPFFGGKKSKSKGDAGAGGGVANTSGLDFGIRDKAAVPTGTPNKGDIKIKPFRKSKPQGNKSEVAKKTAEREYFNSQLKKLAAGYTSPNTLGSFRLTPQRTLGTGSFGRVLFCEPNAKKGDYMAMKIISKDRVIKTKQVEHTFAEKNILFCIDNNFLVKMTEYFQDKTNLYMALEFVNGGEMFTAIQGMQNRKFNWEQTRFFAAQTVLAFEYLNNLDIVFRDLKPENMLIDYRGHIRLTDFGFAKRVDDRTWTMCGTPEYLAPEIIVNKGYNHAVDWWAVGVLIYEMRTGRSPFESRSQLDMFKKIARREFRYPRFVNSEEQDLIGNLLMVDLTARLGNMHGGAGDIKARKYFSEASISGVSYPAIDWEAMSQMAIPSPYKVSVKDGADCKNFDKYPEEPVGWVAGADSHGDIFVGF